MAQAEFQQFKKLQIEAGNKPTAWSPSPRDTQSSLNANAEAIKITQAEVKKHGETLFKV